MSPKPVHRCIALALAAVVTLVIVGGLNRLARLEDGSPLWAQQACPRA